MLPWCFQSYFSSVQLSVREEMSLKEFQDGGLAAVLDMDCNHTLENLNLNIAPNASYVVSAKTDFRFKRNNFF